MWPSVELCVRRARASYLKPTSSRKRNILLSRRLVNETNRQGSFLNCLILGPNPLSSAAHRQPLYLLAGVPIHSVGPSFLGVDALTGAGGKQCSRSGGSADRLFLGAGAWPLFAVTLISQFLWSLYCSVAFSLFSQQQEKRMRISGPGETSVPVQSPHCKEGPM